jgi:hypothetical protein
MKEGTSKGVGRSSNYVRVKLEAQTDSTLFQFRSPGTTSIETDVQVVFGVDVLYMARNIISSASSGTGSRTKFIRIRRESFEQVDIQNLFRCCDVSFGVWALYCVGT